MKKEQPSEGYSVEYETIKYEPKGPLGPLAFMGYYLLFLVLIGFILGTGVAAIVSFIIVFWMDRRRRQRFEEWKNSDESAKKD